MLLSVVWLHLSLQFQFNAEDFKSDIPSTFTPYNNASTVFRTQNNHLTMQWIGVISFNFYFVAALFWNFPWTQWHETCSQFRENKHICIFVLGCFSVMSLKTHFCHSKNWNESKVFPFSIVHNVIKNAQLTGTVQVKIKPRKISGNCLLGQQFLPVHQAEP